jgi:hypothetical protein
MNRQEGDYVYYEIESNKIRSWESEQIKLGGRDWSMRESDHCAVIDHGREDKLQIGF